MTQGDPLAIISYVIGILPLIKNFKQEIPDFTNPWYADNVRYLGTFVRIDNYFNSITRQGPGRGYDPKPSKIALTVHPDNLEAGKVLGTRYRFKVCTGAHYLGGYIGDDKSKSNWPREHTLTLENKLER